MKYSEFNFISEFENTYILYNAMSGAVAKMPLETCNCVRKNDIDSLNENERNDMLKCGFIVSDNINEFEQYEQLHQKALRNSNTLYLTIAPTLACNFRCPYCYEEHEDIFMSNEVQAALLKFVEEKIVFGKYKNISTVWYGGEPVLAFQTVVSLSKKLLEICNRHIVKYQAVMVTNGFLLDEAMAEQLKTAFVKAIQITIDGTPETHGQRRILKNNHSYNTYDKILKNVNMIAKKGIFVDIRINLDKENAFMIKRAVDELAKRIEYKKYVRIYATGIFCMEDTATMNDGNLLAMKDSIQTSLQCTKYSTAAGFRTSKNDLLPAFKARFCAAPTGNAFVIAPTGDIYYCWNDIGNKKYRVGSLNKSELNEDMETQHELWIRKGQHLSEECLSCRSLPRCGGGCPRNYVHFDTKNDCKLNAFCIDDVLAFCMDNENMLKK